MSSKYLLLFLGTFLLVQSSFGKTLLRTSTEQAVETTLKPENEDASESASDELLFYIVEEYSTLADGMLKNGEKLLHSVIADISALNDKNEQITAKLEEYSDLVTEIKKQQTKEGEADNIHKFEVLIDLFDMINESYLTSSDKIFIESLQKNGLSDLQEFFKEQFDEVFSKEFYENANEILNSATTEEWPKKTDIQNHLKQLKEENDVEKKIELFNEFLHYF